MSNPGAANPAAPFPNPPARLVVLSVEYPAVTLSAAIVSQLQEAFRNRFPIVTHHAEARLTVGIGASATARQQVVAIPSFSTRDRRISVAVAPQQVVIETRQYDGFDWYLDLIRGPLAVVESVLAPDAVLAIGHRFIDEVHLPQGQDEDLTKWFDPSLVAMPTLPDPAPRRWQAVVSYQFDDDSHLTLRYGPIDTALVPSPDGRAVTFSDPVIGLDWDSRWNPSTAPEFESAAIADQVAQMYAPVRSLFHRSCTDDLRQLFETHPEEPRR